MSWNSSQSINVLIMDKAYSTEKLRSRELDTALSSRCRSRITSLGLVKAVFRMVPFTRKINVFSVTNSKTFFSIYLDSKVYQQVAVAAVVAAAAPL